MRTRAALRFAAGFERKALLVGVILTVAMALVWLLPSAQSFELKTLDLFFRLKGSPEPHPQLIHVDIDDSSIEKIGRWPWDRRRHAQLVDVLTEAGARAIVFDVTFPDLQSAESDGAFAAACAASGRVFIGYNLRILRETDFQVGSLPWYDEAAKALLKDMTLDSGELAQRLNVDAADIEHCETRLKEAIIEEELSRRLDSGGNLNIDGFLAEVIPPARLGSGSFEERAVRRITDRLRSEAVLARSAFSETVPEYLKRETVITPPLLSLARTARGCGFVSVEPDERDGVLRHTPLLRHYRGKCYGYLSLVVMRSVEDMEISLSEGEMTVRSDSREFAVPMNEDGEVLLDWLNVEDFERIPFAAVVQVADMREAARENLCQEALSSRGFSSSLLEARRKLAGLSGACASSEDPCSLREDILKQRDACSKETGILISHIETLVSRAKGRNLGDEARKQVAEFDRLATASRKLLGRADELLGRIREKVEGKICIVGSTHTGSTDLHPTPIAAEVPGCMAHSSIMSMFSSESFPRIPWGSSSLVLLLAGGLLITFVSSRLSALRSVIITVLALGGMVVFMFVLFALTGIYLGVAGPFSGIVVAFAGTAAYRRFAEESAKRKIRSIFQRQVGEAMAEQLLSHGEEVKLGGEMRSATVYFSDVAGFSAISEKLTPPELVELLNEYYTVMCEPVVEIYGGYLDKFEGDAILAVFGIPLEGENHARDACYAAIENQKALAGLRKKLSAQGKPEIRQRIGLSTGEMVVGYVGSPQRHDYTVLGDAVNLGQRLEGASKLYGTSIIISEATFAMARDFIEVRELDLARVPGRAKPVKLYELAAKKGELPEEKVRGFGVFAEALALYRSRSFAEAKEKFEEVLGLLPDDGPGRLYVKRCEQHIESPPPDDWDGVHEIGMK